MAEIMPLKMLVLPLKRARPSELSAVPAAVKVRLFRSYRVFTMRQAAKYALTVKTYAHTRARALKNAAA